MKDGHRSAETHEASRSRGCMRDSLPMWPVAVLAAMVMFPLCSTWIMAEAGTGAGFLEAAIFVIGLPSLVVLPCTALLLMMYVLTCLLQVAERIASPDAD